MFKNDTLSAKQKYNIVLTKNDFFYSLGLVSVLNENSKFNLIGVYESGIFAYESLPKEANPDILILTGETPIYEKVKITQLFKARWPDIKIIVITHQRSRDFVIKCLELKIHAYCLKSTKLEQLESIIQMVGEGAVWLDPEIAYYALSVFTSQNTLKNAQQKLQYLSERERETLTHLLQGKNNNEIAEAMCISVHTVKAHIGSLTKKLDVTGRLQLATIAAMAELDPNYYAPQISF